MNRWPLAEFDCSTLFIYLFFLIIIFSSLDVLACRTQASLRFFLFFVKLGRLREHRRQGRGSRGSVASPIEILGSPTHVLVPKKLLRMYLTTPVDIGDYRTHIFCPQMGLKNYLRSTMKHDRLSNCLLMHCHKSIAYTLETLR